MTPAEAGAMSRRCRPCAWLLLAALSGCGPAAPTMPHTGAEEAVIWVRLGVATKKSWTPWPVTWPG